MHTQIAEAGVALDQIARRLRDHDLSPMGSSGDPCGPVDVDAHIAFGCDERLAGVNSDSHPDRALGETGLPFARRLDRVPGSRERVEERIALRIHLDTAV